MFPPFSTLPVFNQATCNLVLPAENMVDLPHRRSNNPRGLPGSVHYQLPAPANTSCTMRFSTPKARTLDPHTDVQRCTNSVCSYKNKYIYISNVQLIITTVPLRFLLSLFLGVSLLFQKPYPGGVSQFFFRATTTTQQRPQRRVLAAGP